MLPRFIQAETGKLRMGFGLDPTIEWLELTNLVSLSSSTYLFASEIEQLRP
jgi:hypothetical protein